MPESISDIDRFYKNQPVYLSTLGTFGNELTATGSIEVLPLERQQNLTVEEVIDKLKDIKWNVVTYEGSDFEIATLNYPEADTDNAVLRLATYSSSISGKPGNAFEFAHQAILNPTVPQVYIASFGHGGTSVLSAKERAYYRESGRLTWDEGFDIVPLPTIQKLIGALTLNGLHITKLGTDSAGSVAGIAVGVGLPEGQVTHTAFNSHPQLTEVNTVSLTARVLGVEMIYNARKASKTTPDKWAVNKKRIEAVKASLPDIYSHPRTSSFMPHLNMLMSTAVALSYGIDGKKNPLAHDLTVFIDRQPESLTNFMVAEHDPLNTSKLNRNIHDLFARLSASNRSRPEFLRFVKLPGATHAFNTYRPQFYQALISKLLEL